MAPTHRSGPPSAAPPPATRFPSVPARSLTGSNLQLPAGFDGRLVVAVIAFRQQHRLVDSWATHLDALARRTDGLRWYEVPVLGRQWAPLRPFIDGGMARGINDDVVCARTVTVYGDVRRVCEPLGITDRSTITVVLTDRSGRVHWLASGGWTASAAGGLDDTVAALSPPGT